MPLIHVSGPAGEPVTPEEIKAAARIDADIATFDSQIAMIIPGVRRQAEKRLGRCLLPQVKELVLDAFPAAEIDLLLPDVTSITSVKYLDEAGVEQTMADTAYSLDSTSAPCWLLPAYGTTWPATIDSANALRVCFTVGLRDAAADIPQDIRLWIIAHTIQVLRSADGLVESDWEPLPFVDGLLADYVFRTPVIA